MRRSSLALVATLALSAAFAPAMASAAPIDPAAGHATPSPVSHVRTYSDSPGITVTWTDPTTRVDHAAVRYARGPKSPGVHDGHAARVAPSGTSAKLRHLARNTVYSVTVWAVDAHGDRSTPRHAHFTTGGGHVGRGQYTARYVDQVGHPLAGVVAFAANVDTDHEVTATSGRSGRVSFDLPAGEYFLGADGDDATGGGSDATGYVGRVTIATIRTGHVLAAGAIALRPGGIVNVHVVNTAGKPVKGVTPTLVPVLPYVDTSDGEAFFDAEDSLAAYHRTDGDGNVTLRAVEPGFPFRVCVNTISGPADATRGYLAACSSTSDMAEAGGTVSATTLTLQRQAGGTIHGVVRARGRAGFAGAYVEVRVGHKTVAYVATGRNGAFDVGGLSPGTYRVCADGGSFSQVGRTGYRPGCAGKPVTVPPSLASRSTTIMLHPAAAAAGTVTGPHGVPVPGVDLDFERDRSGDLEGTTDTNGHWVEKGLPAGPDSVCVFSDNELPTAALPAGVRGNCNRTHQHLQLLAGRVRSGIDMRLPAGGAIAGQVLDKAGRPVPYAIVVAGNAGRETTAGPHGRFRLIGLHAGRVTVCAGVGDEPYYVGVTKGCTHAKVHVSTGRVVRNTRVVVPVTSSIVVTTVDENGRPVAGVDATAVRRCAPDDCDGSGTPLLTHRNTSVEAAATTDGHGRVRLDDLRPGHYAVCLFAYYARTRAAAPATGYADRCSADDTFDIDVHGTHSRAVRLVLHPAGTVTGRITDADGDPLQGVLVHVQGSAADDLPAEVTEFNPYGDPFGDDDGGAAAAPGYYSRTAADGTFSVRSVQPGQQLVCADPSAATGGTSQGGYLRQCVGGAPGSTHKGTPVTVGAGATTSGVDLAVTAGGAISGTVSTAIRGAHPDSYVVLLKGQDEVAQVERHGRNFAYTFQRLAAGTYAVCVASFDGQFSVGRCYQNIVWDYPQYTTPPTAQATPVAVGAGSATDIDIALPG